MKKFQKLNESKFTKFTKNQVSSIVGGKAQALIADVSLTCITSTGCCDCTDAGGIDPDK